MAIRPVGRASCYKAEVYALAMASDLATPDMTIRTDSQAAIKAVQGDSQRITLGELINTIRENVA